MKLDLYGLTDICDYFDFHRGKVNCVGGYFYHTNTLSEAQKMRLKQYKNVKLYRTRSQYAPEITHNIVFLGDKCFA